MNTGPYLSYTNIDQIMNSPFSHTLCSGEVITPKCNLWRNNETADEILKKSDREASNEKPYHI
jgi:hypothetical protein